MMLRVLLAAVTLPNAVAFKCNYLDPVNEERVHYEYSRFKDFIKEIDCPKLQAQKGWTAIYGCYSRVDNGVVSMGCHNTTLDEEEKLCKRAQISAKMECNYYPKTPMGAFHPSPGNGICCCVEGNGCNEPPPDWLVGPTPDYLETSVGLKHLAHFGFILTLITIFTGLFMLAAVIHHFIEKALMKRTKKPVNEKSQPEMVQEEEIEEKSAIGPESSSLFSDKNYDKETTASADGNKKGALRSDISGTPSNLQTPPADTTPFVLAETQKTSTSVVRPRTAVAKSQIAKSRQKSQLKQTTPMKVTTPLVSAASPSARMKAAPTSQSTQRSSTQ